MVGDLCQGLAERGFAVTVRCAYPYYPEWKDKTGRNGWRIWRYVNEGVTVERFGLYIPRNPNSLLQRLVHEMSFLLSLLRGIGSARRFDLVMAYCPAVTCVGFAVAAKLLFRRPLWLNIQDLAAEAAAASGLVHKRWLAALMRRLQAWLFNRAEVWSTISPAMAERLLPVRRRNQPLQLLPNWLHASLGREIAKYPRKSGEWPRERPPRLLYSGNIGKKQNLLALLRILQMSDLVFEFTVHGTGAQGPEVERWIRGTADARFSYGPFLDEAGFARALHAADFFVITEAPNSGASFMPSKLVPGIASGAPILAVCDVDSPLGWEVQKFGLGPWLSWNDADRIGQVLGGIAQGPDRYRHWVACAYRRAESLSREAIIGRFAEGLHLLARQDTVATDY